MHSKDSAVPETNLSKSLYSAKSTGHSFDLREEKLKFKSENELQELLTKKALSEQKRAPKTEEVQEIQELEKIKLCLDEETERIAKQQRKMKKFLLELQKDKGAIEEEKRKLKKIKAHISAREKAVLEEKSAVTQERKNIEEENQKLEALRSELNQEYALLKKQKYYSRTFSSLLAKTQDKVFSDKFNLNKQKRQLQHKIPQENAKPPTPVVSKIPKKTLHTDSTSRVLKSYQNPVHNPKMSLKHSFICLSGSIQPVDAGLETPPHPDDSSLPNINF